MATSPLFAGRRRTGAMAMEDSMLSTSRGKQHLLIDCPRCAVRVIKIRSKQPETYGEVFFKCPNNIKASESCSHLRLLPSIL